MIDRHHHQPPNATPYERAMSESLDRRPELLPAVEALHAFKFNPPDPIIPYLIAEYGLTEIEDYLRDPRAVLKEGISWQRLIGTPAAIHKALRWIQHDGDIEEFPAKARKWWWFQVHLPFEVRNTGFVTPMTELVKASKPLRSEFARVTAGHDVRAFRLNTHRLNGGGGLNNWSGRRRAAGEPVLSLRIHQRQRTVLWPDPVLTVRTTTLVTSRVRVRYELPANQRIAAFAAMFGSVTRYSDPAIQTFQNAPFVNEQFGNPASRAHIGFS